LLQEKRSGAMHASGRGYCTADVGMFGIGEHDQRV
jgi:hypothetical protein